MYKVKRVRLIGTWKTRSLNHFYKVNIFCTISSFLTGTICIYIDNFIYTFALTNNILQRAATGLYQNKWVDQVYYIKYSNHRMYQLVSNQQTVCYSQAHGIMLEIANKKSVALDDWNKNLYFLVLIKTWQYIFKGPKKETQKLSKELIKEFQSEKLWFL